MESLRCIDVSIQDNLKHFRNSLFLRLKVFDGVILDYQASSRISLKFVATWSEKIRDDSRNSVNQSQPSIKVLTTIHSFDRFHPPTKFRFAGLTKR